MPDQNNNYWLPTCEATQLGTPPPTPAQDCRSHPVTQRVSRKASSTSTGQVQHLGGIPGCALPQPLVSGHTMPHFLGSRLHVTLLARNGGAGIWPGNLHFSRSTVFEMQRAQRPDLEKHGIERDLAPRGRTGSGARAGPAWRQGGCGRADAGAPGGVRQDCTVGEGDISCGSRRLKTSFQAAGPGGVAESTAGPTTHASLPHEGQAHTGTSCVFSPTT